MTRYHSRVFDALRRTYLDLQGVSFPAHPTAGTTPTVSMFSGSPDVASREWVEVNVVVDDGVIEWRALGNGASRDERFTILVTIITEVPGVTNGDTVLDRLEDLADAVQGAWYNTSTGAFTPPAFDGVVSLGGVTAVSVQGGRSDEGYVGSCVVALSVASRI